VKFLERLLGRRGSEKPDTKTDQLIDQAEAWSKDIERRLRAIDVDRLAYEDEDVPERRRD
jgi:hemerythrin superfamily protein